MWFSKRKNPPGRLDGTGATIIYTHQSKREQKRPHEKCIHYSGYCSNKKAQRYMNPCYKTCSWWEGYTPKKPNIKNGQGNSKNINRPHQEPKIDPIKQERTLCKYYEAETGKCRNIRCELDSSPCEWACINWEPKPGSVPTKNKPGKQKPPAKTKNVKENFVIKHENIKGKVKDTSYLTVEEFAETMNGLISKMGIEKKPHEECKFYAKGTGKCSHPDNTRFVGKCDHQCGYFIKVIKK